MSNGISHKATYRIKLHRNKVRMVYESQIITSKNVVFLSLKIDFVSANSADPHEMPHDVAFHLCLQCL